MNNLIVCLMGQDCERYLKMSLESVKEADIILYLDGGSKDDSIKLAQKYGAVILRNKFNQKDKLMNSKQRNFYLDYLKKYHMGDWCLVLDADEVVSDFDKIKELINWTGDLKPLISLKMRHFENILGFEDATEKEHFVPNRLFKISEDLFYPDGEHTILCTKKPNMKQYCGNWDGITIWHLAYCSGIFDFRKRYLNHLKKSEIHTKEFLEDWYFSHLFGLYPRSQVNLEEIPSIILKEFLIEPDKVYFMNRRNLEVKHFLMMSEWKKYFKPETILDLGCGLGMYGFAADSMGIIYRGIDKSKWAIDNTKYSHLDITIGDIRDKHDFKDYDLVLVVDVLEHLEEKDLDQTLENIKGYGKHFLFSIPVKGDPNLLADPTHKIHKSQEWWINKLTNNFKLEPTPEFMFKEQIFVGVPK